MRLDGFCDVASPMGSVAAGLEGVVVGALIIGQDVVLLPVVLLIAARCGPPT